ncbi:MAG: DinB family protein [Acidobacteriota bacterium]
MRSEEAVFLHAYLLRQIGREFEITRRILAAVPERSREYRPHAEARSAIELAWHLASCEIWFYEGILHGYFGERERMPYHIRAIADVVAHYGRNVPELLAELRKLGPEQLTRGVSLFGSESRPAVTFLSAALAHTIHHRGQLSAYLRAMGAPVPAVYGDGANDSSQTASR